jgi:hypothetical protein
VDGYESSHGDGADYPGKPGGAPEPASSDTGDEQIMARLPRSRPTRQTSRRKRPAPPRRAARPRPASPRAGEARSTDQAVFGPGERAPGLPRLALDGAIEAVKMPVKVGANVTLRALDAVINGLRRR